MPLGSICAARIARCGLALANLAVEARQTQLRAVSGWSAFAVIARHKWAPEFSGSTTLWEVMDAGLCEWLLSDREESAPLPHPILTCKPNNDRIWRCCCALSILLVWTLQRESELPGQIEISFVEMSAKLWWIHHSSAQCRMCAALRICFYSTTVHGIVSC